MLTKQELVKNLGEALTILKQLQVDLTCETTMDRIDALLLDSRSVFENVEYSIVVASSSGEWYLKRSGDDYSREYVKAMKFPTMAQARAWCRENDFKHKSHASIRGPKGGYYNIWGKYAY